MMHWIEIERKLGFLSGNSFDNEAGLWHGLQVVETSAYGHCNLDWKWAKKMNHREHQ